MKKLYDAADRFCARHPRFGIPDLMRWIVIGNVVVYVLMLLTMRTDASAVSFLYLNGSKVLHGELWRIVTFIFVPTSSSPFWLAISLYFYYWIGSSLERQWGTARFNLYYWSGVLLTVIATLAASAISGVGYSVGGTGYVNLSMFLAFAFLFPDTQLLLFFFIPIKMKYMAWVYLGFTVLNVFSSLQLASFLSFYWLLPVVPLLNYFLFFGSDVKNILPDALRYRQRKNYRTTTTNARPNPNWAGSYRSKSGEKPYRHKCTVCGRTDTDYPNLEFRYCSKCNGYYCYCIDHINNHVHITTPPEGAGKEK